MNDYKYVIDVKTTDEFQWLLAHSAAFKQLKDEGEKGLTLFPCLLQDFFYALWLDHPKIMPFGQTSCGARLNRLAMEQLIKNREYKNARPHTRGNLPGAAMAAMYFSGLLLVGLNDNIIEIANEISAAETELYHALLQNKTAARISGSAWEMAINDLARQYADLSRQWDDQAAETQQKLRSLGARLNMFWHTSARKKLATSGEGEQGDKKGRFSTGAEGRGVHQGVWAKGDLSGHLKMADVYLNSPKLKRLAERLGRLKEVRHQRRAQDYQQEAMEITGIDFGNDLTLLVPEEWLEYLDPVKKKGFAKKYVDEALCIYDYQGRRRHGKGSLIICLDNSGSMQGPKEETGKAIVMALLEIAITQKRDAVIIMFGGPDDELQVFEAPQGRCTTDQLVEIAECFLCSAGTDFEKPLLKALTFLEKDKYPGGDIIFITDGVCSASQEFLEQYHAVKRVKKFRTVVVIVNYGQVSTAPVEAFGDELLMSRDLKGHDIAGQLMDRIQKG